MCAQYVGTVPNWISLFEWYGKGISSYGCKLEHAQKELAYNEI